MLVAAFTTANKDTQILFLYNDYYAILRGEGGSE